MRSKGIFISLVFSLVFSSLSLGQDSVQYYLNEGTKSYELEKYSSAERAFSEATRLDPSNYNAVKKLADSKHKQDKFEDAILLYNNAENLNSTDPELYFNRGAAYVFTQDFRLAIKDFNRSIEMRPDFPDVYYYRGYCLAEQARYKAAIADYDKAILLKPDYPAAYYNRGAAKAELKSYEAGMTDFEKALDMKPDLVNGRINIALSKLGMKKYEEAIVDLTKVIDMRDENLAKAYYYRGEAKYELDQKEDGCADWRRASNLGHEIATENVNSFCSDSKRRAKKRDIEIVF